MNLEIKKFIKKFIKKESFIYKLWLRYVYKIRSHSTVVIELTDRCNLACSYCPKSKGIGIGSKIIPHSDFIKMYDNLSIGTNPRLVSLVGFGEPLINKDLYKAVKYTKEKTPKAIISVTTNGILYTPTLAQKLSDAGLNQMIVSLNLTSKETYLKYNLDDYFDTILENLKGISQIKANIRTKIIVQVLDLKENRENLKEIEDWLISLGYEFQLKPFLNWGGEFDAEKENNKFKNIRRYPCANVEQYLWLHLNGDVQVCCSVYPNKDSRLIIGNIFQQTAKEIINGKKYEEIKRLNSENCLVSIDECKNCNAWAETPNFYIKIFNKWR